MKYQVALLVLLVGFIQTVGAGVSEIIGRLEVADLATAKDVVKSLDSIAKEENNPDSKLAGSLSREIKKTFTAELTVQQATKGATEDAKRAEELDQQGSDHLRPNGLGSVNTISADADFKAAREMRASALKRLNDSSASLTIALKDLRRTSQNSALSENDQKIIGSIADAIETRTIKPAETASTEMRSNIQESSAKLKSDQAARELNAAEKDANRKRETALRQMQRAIKSGSPADEAKALKMLMNDAPDAVPGFNKYLAAQAARARSAQDDQIRRKLDEINQKIK